MNPLQNTVRAQSDLFTVQCCHSDSRQMNPLQNTVRGQGDLFTVQCYHSNSKAGGPPLVNIVRAQSYLFTVQCCHSYSNADGPPSQHCQSTEWSLHCSMLSFRLKGRWTPLVNTVRTQSDFFTVQCCHSDSKADGPPWSTLSEHRVISSLFNVVIQTQRQMDTQVNTVRAQSYLFTVQCCHSDSKADWHPPVNTVRTQSYFFTVQCCHSDSKAEEPPAKHCQSTEWSLHCSMLSFRLKGRWKPLVNFVRAELSLHCSMLSFRLKCRWTPQSTLSEHRVISSLFNVVIETQRQMDPPGQHCQSTGWFLHCSMLSFRFKGRWTPTWSTLSEHRLISSLFNVVI